MIIFYDSNYIKINEKLGFDMIDEFKIWFDELGFHAMERKKQIALVTGKRPKWTNSVKNKEIKQKFTEKARELSCIKSRSSIDRKAREWLYDLTWREFNEKNQFVGVKLAMEIELSDIKTSGLIYDFNKLLQSDAEYKVFVFQQSTIALSVEMFEMLSKAALAYRVRSPAKFLLVCWCWESGRFLYCELDA